MTQPLDQVASINQYKLTFCIYNCLLVKFQLHCIKTPACITLARLLMEDFCPLLIQLLKIFA